MDCGVSNLDIKLNFIAKINAPKAFLCILKTDIARCLQKLDIILENKVGISITTNHYAIHKICTKLSYHGICFIYITDPILYL